MEKPRWILTMLLLACGDAPAEEPVAVTRAGELELIGISGRRLEDGDTYRVPLDSERAVIVGRPVREALVAVNRGVREVSVRRLSLTAVGDTAEWRLLMPTRAVARPLEAAGAVLAPEGRLDFDVAVSARGAGTCTARLEIAWQEGSKVRTRAIELRAIAVSAPSATGPGPP